MRPIERGLTKLPYGLAGKIYRSPLPNSPMFDPEGGLLDAYLNYGIDTVVMLTPDEEVLALTGQDLRRRYHELGFEVIYEPVPDFTAPAVGTLNKPLQAALSRAEAGEAIVIHCHAGIGRTGIFTACLAKIVFDLSGEEAVAWVRQYIARAVETDSQYQFVVDFKTVGFNFGS